MGIPFKIAFDQFPYVFLPEATGGNMGIPIKIAFNFCPTFSYRRQREATWEYRSKSLLINFPMFSYRRQREATGGNGRQREYRSKLLLTFSLCFLTGGNGTQHGNTAQNRFGSISLCFLTGGNGRQREYRSSCLP